MQRRNVWFPDPLVVRTEEIATEMDIKFAEVVRRALEKFVEQRDQEKQKRPSTLYIKRADHEGNAG